jgi:hypothetical protein
MAMLFFPRFTAKKYEAWPSGARGGDHCRLSSPLPGCSTLMTSAP